MLTYERVKKHLRNKSCIFFQAKKGKILRAIQSIYIKTKFGVKSMWTHVGILIDGYFYESTVRKEEIGTKKFLGIKFKKTKLIYGCIKTPVEERFSDKELKNYNQLGIQYDFGYLEDFDWGKIKARAEKFVEDKINYAGEEIFGTLLWILKWRISNKKKRKEMEQQPNRFDNENVYCVAMTADCMEACQKKIETSEGSKKLEYVIINHSISTVDEAWLCCNIPCNNDIVKD